MTSRSADGRDERVASWTKPRDDAALEDTALEGTPYRRVAALARGAMGEVVLAEHVALAKPVVVKLLHKDLAARPELVDRMRVEAQTLARLEHPNLVSVSDLGQNAEGRTYLVMERLSGRTLREELAARGALPVAEAVDLVLQALAGLAAAHAAGIIHRDVKLENIFVCDPDAGHRVVKLLDFGIAKVLASGNGLAPAPLEFPTETGAAIGTPRFVSPEQARREPIDQRADIYAMGVVLFTLLCGRGPFDHHRKAVDVLLAHAAEAPPAPSQHASQPLPDALDRAVLRALAKRPDDRFASAADLAAELGAIAAQLRAPSRWARTEKMEDMQEALELARTRMRAQSPADPDLVATRARDASAFDTASTQVRDASAFTAARVGPGEALPVQVASPKAPFRDPFLSAPLLARRPRLVDPPPPPPAAQVDAPLAPAPSHAAIVAVLVVAVALAGALATWLLVLRS